MREVLVSVVLCAISCAREREATTVAAPPSATAAAPAPAAPRAPSKVRLTSEPPGATVTVGGVIIGMTPIELEAPVEVRVSRMGYQDATETITGGGERLVRLEALPPIKHGHSPHDGAKAPVLLPKKRR